MKIPRNLKHADYVDLIKDIDKRCSITSQKVIDYKKMNLKLKDKLDEILNKLNNLERRYCELLLETRNK